MNNVSNQKYDISIKSIEKKEFNIDNYDYIFNPENICETDDFIKVIEINIKNLTKQDNKKYALYDLYYNEDEQRVIIKDDDLIILLSKSINRISLINNEIKYHMKLNSFGVAWEIFDVSVGYVIHHETSVIMLNKDLSVKWDVNMPDITTTPSTKNRNQDFKIGDNMILVKCFDGSVFSIDFDGNSKQIN